MPVIVAEPAVMVPDTPVVVMHTCGWPPEPVTLPILTKSPPPPSPGEKYPATKTYVRVEIELERKGVLHDVTQENEARLVACDNAGLPKHKKPPRKRSNNPPDFVAFMVTPNRPSGALPLLKIER
jgi:hypothetical protein